MPSRFMVRGFVWLFQACFIQGKKFAIQKYRGFPFDVAARGWENNNKNTYIYFDMDAKKGIGLVLWFAEKNPLFFHLFT